jgi:hypothetical protein
MNAVFEFEAAWRPSTWYATRARRGSIIVGAIVVTLAVAYAAAIVATGGDSLLLAPLAAVIVGIAVVSHPTVGVYLLFGAALLLEQAFPVAEIHPITQTRFFENLSSYTPLPLRLSLLDLLILLTVAGWAVRRATGSQAAFRIGPFGWAVAGYASVFVAGAVMGASRGGWNLDAALNEMRGPAHMVALYFLGVNLVRDRTQVTFLVWEFVVLVGVKALQGLLSYVESLSLPYAVESVTNHEDVVFFNVAIGLMVVLAVLRVRTKVTYALLALQPLILTVELLTQRRAGFIALGVVLLVVTILLLTADRRRALTLAGIGALLLCAYVIVFWQQSGPLGEPTRALRSVVDPSELSARDQMSNRWRDIENQNIAFTIRQFPFTGVGVGQQYLFQQEPPGLLGAFAFLRYITHNALLWLWLIGGPIGAFALWFLVARVLLVGSALFAKLQDPSVRWLAAFPVVLMVSQVVFSAVDQGLTFSRAMIVLGTALGLTSAITALPTPFSASPLLTPMRPASVPAAGAAVLERRPSGGG